MKKIFFLILATILITSCDPPPPEPQLADYEAVLFFPAALHTVDVHTSIFVQYRDLSYSLVTHHITPMQKGQRYSDTLRLYGIDTTNVQFVFLNVQQGYIVPTPWNNIQATFYVNGAPRWSGIKNQSDPDNTWNHLICEY